MNKNLENYLDYSRKFAKMQELVSKWELEYCVEKMKPLIDDGFEFEDIVEWFSITLNDFMAINEANKE